MKEFKIRCSAIGQIMTNAKKKGELSKTTQSYCQTWKKEQLYGRRKTFSNKYTEKGLITEDNSIDFVAEQLSLGFILKNDKFFEDEFITGTPDVILNDTIIDVKNSWDCFTFPLFETKINKDYYWQAQGYMHLCNKENYKLIYVLSDTPTHLIEKEAFWYAKSQGYSELDNDILDKFVKQMTYGDIANELKMKVYDIKRNNEDIELIKQRVIECRNYIQSL